MKKIHTGLSEAKLDEQTRFEDEEAKALSQKEAFKLNKVCRTEREQNSNCCQRQQKEAV